jgi:glucosamine-6-phosphate deaminase
VTLLGGEIVANRLRARPHLRLILPTGHTPLGMYAALRAHATDGSLPTAQAELFQLDEYRGLAPDDPRSYGAYLRRELAGIEFAAVHGIDGAAADAAAECARHQALLDEAPLDLVVLGLGRDGHVAFDEPGAPPGAGMRVVALHATTRADAAADFGGVEAVPTEAFTVGLRTILAARELLMLVNGEAKARALLAMLEGEVDPSSPASLLRDHPRLAVVCDTEAASLLTPQPGWASDRAVIVLGHREPGLSAADRLSDESLERIRRAERVCARHAVRVVLLTGYSHTPDGLSEAEQMKAVWTVPGVPAVLEDAGRNTAENATRSLPLIRAIGDVRHVTVVTSAWHLRTLYFFAPYRALGLQLRFAGELRGPWLRMLLTEFHGALRMRRQRREALAAMRLPEAS